MSRLSAFEGTMRFTVSPGEMLNLSNELNAFLFTTVSVVMSVTPASLAVTTVSVFPSITISVAYAMLCVMFGAKRNTQRAIEISFLIPSVSPGV